LKGLNSVPGIRDLQRAYDRLQSSAELIEVDLLALYTQWARLDPRLAEILTGHLSQHWREIPLGRLIELLDRQPWPRAIAVPLRFVALGLKSKVERKTILHMVAAIEGSFAKPAAQLYFIPLRLPNVVVMRKEIEFRSTPYLQSGFLGAQPLLPRARPPTNRTLMPPRQRHRILAELFKHQPSLTVNDFVRACHGLVSKRQAQRDLRAFSGSSAKGFTRGRIYRRSD
jgi:hypothetical protein